MTQEDINEVMSKSLTDRQLRQLAEDGGNIESALELIKRLEDELLKAQAKAAAYDRLMSGGRKNTQGVGEYFWDDGYCRPEW